MRGEFYSYCDILLWKLGRAILHGNESDAYWLTRLLVQLCCPRKF